MIWTPLPIEADTDNVYLMLQGVSVFVLTTMAMGLNLTYRYSFRGKNNREIAQSLSRNNNYIYGFWHQNIFATICAHKGQAYAALISGSKDGEIVSGVARYFGFTPVRGSSSKGGVRAMDHMVNLIHDGLPGAVTLDGPRGPAHKTKRGIVEMAKKTRTPILPLMVLPQRYWFFKKSWDEFRIPKPFSKIYVAFGNPIQVSQDLPREKYAAICQQIENELENLENNLHKEM